MKTVVERPIGFDCELEKCLPYLFSLALRYTRNTEKAEDLVQMTAYKALLHFCSFRLGTNMKNWLIAIMINEFRSSYRKDKVERIAFESIRFRGSKLHTSNEVHHQLQVARIVAEELPSAYKDAFMLWYTCGFKYKEISETLGCPMGTVKAKLFRARQFIMSRVESMGEFMSSCRVAQ